MRDQARHGARFGRNFDRLPTLRLNGPDGTATGRFTDRGWVQD